MDTRPDVKRDSIPEKPDALRLYSADSPERPGYEPDNGDVGYKLTLDLHDGRQLLLFMGKEACANFVAMLAACAADDADEELEIR